MRGGLGFGLVVVGLVLLWVVVTGRGGNFAAAWSTLKGGPGAGSGAEKGPVPGSTPYVPPDVGTFGGMMQRLFTPESALPSTAGPRNVWTVPTLPVAP